MLIISYFFPPAGGVAVLRTVKLAKYIKKYGIEPVVLTPEFPITHRIDENLLEEIDCEIVRTPQFYLPRISGFKKRSLSEKEITKASKYRKFIASIFRNIVRQFLYPDQELGWIYYAYKSGLRLIRDNEIDILYATTPPVTNMIVLLLLSLKTNLPVVLDFRDDWLCYPLKPYKRYSNWVNPIYYLVDRIFEKYLLKRANLVMSVSRQLLMRLYNRYKSIDKRKFIFIPNGYDEEDFEGVQPAERDDKFLIVYSGTFSPPRKPEVFLWGLKQVFNLRPDIKDDLRLMIVGDVIGDYPIIINDYGLTEIIDVKNGLSHKESISYILSADTLLIINPDYKSAGDTFLPSKLSEYIRAKKNIIAITPQGATSDLIDDWDLGYTADHNDTDGIVDIIIKSYDGNNRTDINISDELLNEFNREELAKKVVMAILDNIEN